MKGVVKNVDLRIDGWTRKADFNIIDMDELGVVLGMDFMEKSSVTLNPYCGVMMMAEWIIPLVSKMGLTHVRGLQSYNWTRDLRYAIVRGGWGRGPTGTVSSPTIDMGSSAVGATVGLEVVAAVGLPPSNSALTTVKGLVVVVVVLGRENLGRRQEKSGGIGWVKLGAVFRVHRCMDNAPPPTGAWLSRNIASPLCFSFFSKMN
ncbi:hypothetical protein RJ639_002138 [Escallonia herrerae]|uniref:Uncharacterized protein n=1 Tax=Escallonia herrerae TaxID=1293975 RepID=A0AA89BH25_9ASTE|nr:hypothetical protein RJ639_002138 [Escallonia herrerae]